MENIDEASKRDTNLKYLSKLLEEKKFEDNETTWCSMYKLLKIKFIIDNNVEESVETNKTYQDDESFWEDERLTSKNNEELLDLSYTHNFHLRHNEC
ncbi:10305_t:CDS:2 [Cetraspora pellucida]|uniref:10305_t:CDS:1 n=1 Tax=Cetraspora pellucida TaxID=1433469 RepID=A0A9N9F9W7_9GLOM|nr:10305_t:CDS:2 [Cetraspora pellucida]